MAVNTKVINRRIKSVSNTKKITKAMELVAASKMRKAVASVLATRPYSTMAWDMVSELGGAQLEEGAHPLVKERPDTKRSLAILITSHRGLCGGFNAQILKIANEFAEKRGAENIDFVAVGRRGESWLGRRKQSITGTFPGMIEEPSIGSVRPVAKMAIQGFLDQTYDEVVLLYTDYISAVAQKPRSKVLLPLRRDSDLGEAGTPEPPSQRSEDPSVSSRKPEGLSGTQEYLFEPDPQTVLDRLLPRIVETQIYQALLESTASEHSARMIAMRSATDSASDMLDDLKFTFNQARQASITQEIAEISAGRAALE